MGPEKIQRRFLPIGIGLSSGLPLAAAPLLRGDHDANREKSAEPIHRRIYLRACETNEHMIERHEH
jgi:hypothetical protein